MRVPCRQIIGRLEIRPPARLRAGVTENPVRLTRSVRQEITRVTSGGAAVYVWPGGGITFMVDVTRLPPRAFGYVPTPALVAPLEFTFLADAFFAEKGMRDQVEIVYATPLEGAFTNPFTMLKLGTAVLENMTLSNSLTNMVFSVWINHFPKSSNHRVNQSLRFSFCT